MISGPGHGHVQPSPGVTRKSIYPSIYRCALTHTHLGHVLNTCLNVNISICNSVCLSVRLFACPSPSLTSPVFLPLSLSPAHSISHGLSTCYALATPSVLKCIPNMQRSFANRHTLAHTLRHTHSHTLSRTHAVRVTRTKRTL